MTLAKVIFVCLVLLIAFTATAPAVEQKGGRTVFSIIARDPGPDATLGTSDKLYLRISYESPVPVRFVAKAIRQGDVQDRFFTSSTPPFDAGRGEALAWMGSPIPVRIDEISVTAYDMEWRELGTLTTGLVATWEDSEKAQTRDTAEWVAPLLKKHRHVFDTVYDPQPQQPAPLFDLFFIISFIAMPIYLLTQLVMLIRYRGRWQWYAAVPLLPFVPMGLYSAFGIGLSFSLWVIFIFRYMTVALIYLMILWVVKQVKARSEQVATPPVNS